MSADVRRELERWQETYQKLFGEALNFSEVRVPPIPGNVQHVRLIVVPDEILNLTEGKLHAGVMKAIKRHFPCGDGFQDDGGLDKVISWNARHPSIGSLAVWVRDELESDVEFVHYSAKELMSLQHTGITALERMLLEADHFFERRLHLDLDTVTICVGSRIYSDSVVCCDWNVDRLFFFGSSPRRASEKRRSRQVWA